MPFDITAPTLRESHKKHVSYSSDKKRMHQKKLSGNPPKKLQGVLTFLDSESREKTVIRRVNAFLPPEDAITINANQLLKKNWLNYREKALQAIYSCIRAFPFFSYSPSVLRSCFGIPTRRDRQRGKHAGIKLMLQAFNIPITSNPKELQSMNLPVGDLESINGLQKNLTGIINEFPDAHSLLSLLETDLNRNPFKKISFPEQNTHSEASLLKVQRYLEKWFDDLDYKIVQSEDQILTPDLIGNYNDQKVWIELKEWDPNINEQLFFKPLKQLFQYLLNTKIVVLICPEKLHFLEFIAKNSSWDLNDLYDKILKEEVEIRKKENDIKDYRKKLASIGTYLQLHKFLSPREEILLVMLISLQINEYIGILSSEHESAEQLLQSIAILKQKYITLSVVPIEQALSTDFQQELILLFGSINVKP